LGREPKEKLHLFYGRKGGIGGIEDLVHGGKEYTPKAGVTDAKN